MLVAHTPKSKSELLNPYNLSNPKIEVIVLNKSTGKMSISIWIR